MGSSVIENKLRTLGSRGFPSIGSIELTTRCNLACRYCFVTPEKKELPTDELCRALDRFADAGIISLMLTGGEPFMREDILDILAYIVNKKFFRTIVLSNGTLLQPCHIDFLAAHAAFFGYLRFSFFSHDPAVHDSFTGVSGSFGRTLANAERLINGGVKVMVIINLTEDNVDTLQKTKEFFAIRGFGVEVGVSKINTDKRIRGLCKPMTTGPFFDRYFSGIEETGLDAMRGSFETICGRPDNGNLLCEQLFSMISLRADGSIVPCLSFRNHAISNITSDTRPLHLILQNSPLLQSLRKLRRADLQKCGVCPFVNFCVLCPGMMHTENGSFEQPLEQTCTYTRRLHAAMYGS